MEENQLEIADLLAEAERNRGIEAARKTLQKQTAEGFDGKHCVEPDCEDELPVERLQAGRIRCTACQTRIEKNAKRGY